MALHGADPALLRHDHRDRLALDHGLGEVDLRGVRAPLRSSCGACRARSRGRKPCGPRGSPRRPSSTAPSRSRAGSRSCAFSLRQLLLLALELHLLEPAQRAQPRVEDGVGLHLGELEEAHQLLLRLVLLADDLDDPVEVEIDDEEAAEDFEAPVDGGEAVARAAQQHLAAMVEPFAQALREAEHLRHLARRPARSRSCGTRLSSSVSRNSDSIRIDRVDGARARLEHDAHVLGGFVAHVGEERQLPLLQQLGDLLDQPRLRHAVGDLGDDDAPQVPRPVSSLCQRARTRNEPRPVR